MEELRLPWSPKEGLLFGCTIGLISSIIIGGANIYLAVPEGQFWSSFIKSLPFVYVFVLIISNTYVSWIAGRVVKMYAKPTDHPNTYICYNLIMCALMMSMSMSILGPFSGQISQVVFDGASFDIGQIFDEWPHIWPRNFCIAFWVEMIIAQPASRALMVHIHKKKLAGMKKEAA